MRSAVDQGGFVPAMHLRLQRNYETVVRVVKLIYADAYRKGIDALFDALC